ncbi:MAG: hypothetical protein IMW89_20730 [Ktedonobacteraceae bacterium]|nr:hypothetical protein [Ktedonobacteraceae bacterium]
MLVAYGPDNRPVVAEEMPLEQLQSWSHERLLHCPNCRSIVYVRGGPGRHTQLHFAHQKGECAWGTESETVRHMRGKLVLAEWLRTQFPGATVTLEERLPEPNRIADIFVLHTDGRRWAIEFQCAPLEKEEWHKRHEAYRKADIVDTWIVGCNRREKQEAFIEAILATAHEIMFLDPQVTPPRIWLRWPLTRAAAQQWQNTRSTTGIMARARPPSLSTLDGWIGHTGYGATIIGTLPEVRLDLHARLVHPVRTSLEARCRLIEAMSTAELPDEKQLTLYLRHEVEDADLRLVLLPLLRAYVRDPDLLRRYNYGRGQFNQPPSQADKERVQKAQQWLADLTRRGFPSSRLQQLVKTIPFVGPYAAFAGYMETLIALAANSATSQ